MQIVTGIALPLQDEHVVATDPTLAPQLPGVWHKRIRAFTGRALTADALTAEQDARAGRLVLRGQSVSSGVVRGIDVQVEAGTAGLTGARAVLHVGSGFAIAQSGEDVSVQTPRRLTIADLPALVRADWLDALQPGAPALVVVPAGHGTPDPNALPSGAFAALPPPLPRRMALRFGDLLGGAIDAVMPRAAVLVAEPVVAELSGRADPADPCPRDPRDDPYDDWQRIDGCRLTLYPWPSEMVATAVGGRRAPDYALPNSGPDFRNQLAWRIFNVEHGFLVAEAHPWEGLGVPLALLGFAPDWSLLFVDRSAVVRLGGMPAPRTPAIRQVGTNFLFQARLSQFVEHLADLGLAAVTPDLLTQAMRQIPPIGILPMSMLDVAARQQSLFPASFDVHAVPIATEQLELAIRESASLAPYSLTDADTVELLVPVPEHAYEPELLNVATVDSLFQRTVSRFVSERTQWLVRRELVRRRRDALTAATTGAPAAWRATDPDEAANERLVDAAQRPPVSTTQTRRVSATGARSHRYAGAVTRLTIAAGDTLYVWVRIVAGAAPTALALEIGQATDQAGGGDWSRGVFWGTGSSLPSFAGDPAGAPRRAGNLPAAGVWTKLTWPAASPWATNLSTLAGLAINGVGFLQAGGTVDWGPFGRIDQAGNEIVYVGDEGCDGAVIIPGTGPALIAVPADPADEQASEDDFGTRVIGGGRTAAALADFRGRWTMPFLAADLADLAEGGFDRLTTVLSARLKTTNDALDLGFTRARSDIYRVRQYILGADAASRLVTSPALADIAVRDDSARAKSDQIKDFLTQAFTASPLRDSANPMKEVPPPPAGSSPAPPPPPPPPPPLTSPIRTPLPSRTLLASATFMRSSSALTTAVSTPSAVVSAHAPIIAVLQPPAAQAAAPAPALAFTTAAGPVFTTAAVPAFTTAAGPVFTTAAVPAFTTAAAAPAFMATTATAFTTSLAGLLSETGARRTFNTGDIQAQLPLVGFAERSASVGERLTTPPALEAYQYALDGKQTVLASLGRLITAPSALASSSGGATASSSGSTRRPGIELSDLPLTGYAYTATTPPPAGRTTNTVGDFTHNPTDYTDTDALTGDPTKRHESDYFTAALAAIDNAIAMMRLAEGRVDLYNRLLADAQSTRNDILARIGDADPRLTAIEAQLAEARHDVAMASALLSEETARIAQINARRTATLKQYAKFLAFRRPRVADRDTFVPISPADAAVSEDPVAACNRLHPFVPAELREMADLFREAPVRWLPPIWTHLRLLDTSDQVLRVYQTVQRRTPSVVSLLQQSSQVAVTGSTKYLAAAKSALVAQQKQLATYRSVGVQMNLGAFNSLNLVAAREQLLDAASMGDLLDGSHGRADLVRRAAQEVEGIAQVAACLYASFGEVLPAIRLAWAEQLSALTAPAPLHNLAALPRWSDLPSESRREQQGLADWLFGRIDPNNAAAVAAMNDLVRVAALMASHAPVNQIVGAALSRPAAGRVGGLLDLQVDTTQVRLGMTVLVRDTSDTVIAHGVVDDLGNGIARARILQAVDPSATIPVSARIHLTHALPAGMHPLAVV